MAYPQNFVETDEPLLRRMRPFVLTMAPRPPLPRPTLRRPGEAIEPPLLPPPSVEVPRELPSLAAPRPMPEPQHPYRLHADEIYNEIERLRENAPDPGFLRTLAGRFVGGITSPELGGFITGETPHYRKLNRLSQQAQLLEGQLTREQQMQKTLGEAAENRAQTRMYESHADLYGAQAEKLRRAPEDKLVGQYTNADSNRVFVFRGPGGALYEEELGQMLDPNRTMSEMLTSEDEEERERAEGAERFRASLRPPRRPTQPPAHERRAAEDADVEKTAGDYLKEAEGDVNRALDLLNGDERDPKATAELRRLAARIRQRIRERARRMKSGRGDRLGEMLYGPPESDRRPIQ